eukprot:PhM_4_TR18806/c0_g1_i4/m.91512
MVGYLMTVDDSIALAKATQWTPSPSMWIGLSSLTQYGVFQWSGGPFSGTFAVGPNWGGGEPSFCIGCDGPVLEQCTETLTASGVWNDRACNVQRQFMCEMGGLPGTQYFRGMIYATVQTTACQGMGGTEKYGFKGTCHTLPELHQAIGATTTRTLFTTDAVPDLLR